MAWGGGAWGGGLLTSAASIAETTWAGRRLAIRVSPRRVADCGRGTERACQCGEEGGWGLPLKPPYPMPREGLG